MQFQLFQIPYIGNGTLIGINAVIHVIISHGLALGALAMVALAEYTALKRNHADGERFSVYLLEFTVITVTGVGSITGVGIWFTTSALSPNGIGSMLRIFFWPWFIEWIVFVFEAAGLLFIYFAWSRLSGEKRKYRVGLGIAYSGLAFISAVLITGIVAFMLTPDGWPWDKSFWSAFLNPSFIPQLLLRLGISFAIGSLVAAAFLLFTRREETFRRELLGRYGLVFAASLVLSGLSAWWYFAVVPSAFRTHAVFSVLTSHLSRRPELFRIVNYAALFFLVLLAAALVSRRLALSKAMIVPALLLVFCFTAEYERIREFIRGPYLMPGYMYSGQITLRELPFLKKEGLLKNAFWFNATGGRDNKVAKAAFLFGQNCSSCHTLKGINDIADRVKGRTPDGIAAIIGHTNEMVPFMPPFSGSEEERKLLAQFLYDVSTGKTDIGSPYRYTPLKE